MKQNGSTDLPRCNIVPYSHSSIKTNSKTSHPRNKLRRMMYHTNQHEHVHQLVSWFNCSVHNSIHSWISKKKKTVEYTLLTGLAVNNAQDWIRSSTTNSLNTWVSNQPQNSRDKKKSVLLIIQWQDCDSTQLHILDGQNKQECKTEPERSQKNEQIKQGTCGKFDGSQ